MGIPCEVLVYIFVNNQSVLYNTSIPDSILNKNSKALRIILFVRVQQGTNGVQRMLARTRMRLVLKQSAYHQETKERCLLGIFSTKYLVL